MHPDALSVPHTVQIRRWALSIVVGVSVGCHPKTSAPVTEVATETEIPSPVSLVEIPWTLHATGVGELIPGNPIPESVYTREGESFDELWTRPMRGLKQMDEYIQGLRDQEGYPLVNFSKLDVVARLTHSDTLLGIWVGASVRSDAGTGVGSTLAELEAAHGELTQYSIPEPYHCAVGVSGLDHVAFLFSDHCSDLQPDTPCAAVYVGGYEDPDME
jgi:hypothetical protein